MRCKFCKKEIEYFVHPLEQYRSRYKYRIVNTRNHDICPKNPRDIKYNHEPETFKDYNKML